VIANGLKAREPRRVSEEDCAQHERSVRCAMPGFGEGDLGLDTSWAPGTASCREQTNSSASYNRGSLKLVRNHYTENSVGGQGQTPHFSHDRLLWW
jgi:hypothetical protein